MQFQVLIKAGQSQELLQRGLIHPLHVGETHVIVDQRQNLVGVIVGKAQASADFRSHLNAHFHVAVKTDSIRGDAERRRLADIVEQGAPGQSRRASCLKFFQQEQRVHKNVALGVKLGRLLDSLHRRNFRQHLAQQAALVEQFERAPGASLGEHLGQFFAYALARDLMDLRSSRRDRTERCFVDFVVESRRESHRPQHAQFVFGKALLRIANGANDSGLEIVAAVDIIEDFVRQRIEQQAIDREIAAQHVFARIFAEADFVGMTAIGVAKIGAEGSDLNNLRPARRHKVRGSAFGDVEAATFVLLRVLCGF